MKILKNLLTDKLATPPTKHVPFLDLTREWAYFENDFLAAFKKFGRAGIYILGSATATFEQNFAAANGYKYGVAVSTGLAALEVALLAHGLKPGDKVITVANSAVATSLAISNIGARPIFCDIKDNYLINENKIEALITNKTRAILPVHLFGQIANLAEINRLAARHQLIVIEDACQAHGANFTGAGVINTKAFSFYPTKNLGALGEGGLILTNDEKIRDFATVYRNYGQQGRYQHLIPGNNYRADALQCLFLNLKLAKLADFIKTRQTIAQKYITELTNLKDLILPEFSSNHSYHLFVIRLQNEKRDALRTYLNSQGIETLIHYPTAIHRQACYAPQYPDLRLEKTDAFQKEILSLPCYPFLKTTEQDYIIKKIKEFFS
ncbi:MAG: DegT/DnrJ/EryC1/StrS family aminotransferase [Patescibacteria group bacterium]